MSVQKTYVQATSVDYALHTLGWKSFQDLCHSILREVLGQAVQKFSDSNDAGRDGAYRGVWTYQKEFPLSGTFTFQCKHTHKQSDPINLSNVKEELKKAGRLASHGLADNYILITNHTVSGKKEEELREEFESLQGLDKFLILGYDWITLTIRESPRLRMLVPRVYGLGDLGAIMDQRAVEQANELLSSLGDDLAKLVITESYIKSAEAITEKGFVLLLGEPAAGKSTIAASLALGAIDRWKCQALFVRTPDELVSHWDVNEARFFWVDDAFGATQYNQSADDWNRVFPKLKAAIKSGTRVVFTSRDYIFRRAQRELKASAFPLIQDSQVIINVHGLSLVEKQQILYNHIKLGNQPKSFRSRIKPLLPFVAKRANFVPEIARRLGQDAFTHGLHLTEESLKDFIDRPLEFLIECVKNLDQHSFAALTLIFMRNGQIEVSLELQADEIEALSMLRSNRGDVRFAMTTLDDVFVKCVTRSGKSFWVFKHPTIRDSVSSIVATDPALIDIYLSGASISNIVNEVYCLDDYAEDDDEEINVKVPSSRFHLIIEKLLDCKDRRAIHRFLVSRCGRDFCKVYLKEDSHLIPEILEIGEGYNVIDDDPIASLAIRLHRCNLLGTLARFKVAERICTAAIDQLDLSFLSGNGLRQLLTDGEMEKLLQDLSLNFPSSLRGAISWWEEGYNRQDDPEEYFEPLVRSLDYLNEYSASYELDRKIKRARMELDEFIAEKKTDYEENKYNDYGYDESYDRELSDLSERSIFDDIDK